MKVTSKSLKANNDAPEGIKTEGIKTRERVSVMFKMESILLNLCKNVACIIILLMLTSYSVASPSEQSKVHLPEYYFKVANTHYWFAIAEHGDMRQFHLAQVYLDSLQSSLLLKEFSDTTSHNYADVIHSLQQDIEYQRDMAHDTFNGVFPLGRFLKSTVFLDAGAAETYEFIDDPDVVAVSTAGESILHDLILPSRAALQYNVVFQSVPRRTDLENELRYIFNNSLRFYVSTDEATQSALDSLSWIDFSRGTFNTLIYRQLKETWQAQSILSVLIDQLFVNAEDYFYEIKASLYKDDGSNVSTSFKVLTVCHDRRQFLPFLIASQFIFLLLAYVGYAFGQRLRGIQERGINLIVIPLVGFLAGRITPWILFPLMSTIKPPAENLAILSFWWAALAGIALFTAPLLIYRLISQRLAQFAPVLIAENRWGAMGIAIGFGTSSYLVVPLLIYLGNEAWLHIILISLSLVSVAHMLGRNLDGNDPYPEKLIVIPILLSIVMGMVLLHLDVLYSFGGAILSIVPAFVIDFWNRKENKPPRVLSPQSKQTQQTSSCPKTLDELIETASKPPFLERVELNTLMENLDQGSLSGFKSAVIIGQRGVGKTALLREVITVLSEGSHVEVLYGECETSSGEGVPESYSPFRQAISQHFGINLLGDPQNQMKIVDQALGDIFDSVVPFGSLIFPPSNSESQVTASKNELYFSILKSIKRLSQKATVLLVIDDIQHIDSYSEDLLEFITRQLEIQTASKDTGSAHPGGVILLAAGDKEALDKVDRFGFSGHILTLETPTVETRERLLVQTLGFAPSTAARIVEYTGEGIADSGGLHWLLEVVSFLAGKGTFIKMGEGFEFAPEYRKSKKLPIPDGIRNILLARLHEFPRYKSVIECAACLGLEFSAENISRALDLNRLDVLNLLEEIERETGILLDDKAKDDHFRFKSTYILDIIRAELSISGHGPTNTNTPQLVREYHARVANALEKDLTKSNSAIFDVANHYYAAGRNWLDKAVEFNLKAAHSASAMFAHDDAREYIQHARECADVTGTNGSIEDELIRIELHEAHVENNPEIHRKVRDQVEEYLLHNPNPEIDLLILFVRNRYEAASRLRGEIDFSEAEKLAERALEKAETQLQEAEARHFLGLSLEISDDQSRWKRANELEKALDLINTATDQDIRAISLKGRVLNSLAEELSYIAGADSKRIEDLYKLSLDIRSANATFDLPGQARSLGGLGRLYTRLERLEEAHTCFLADLDISEKIGDSGGQVLMHSLLGANLIARGNREGIQDKNQKELLKQAVDHYRSSYSLASGGMNKVFAAGGMLDAYSALEDLPEIENAGKLLLDSIPDSGLPKFCIHSTLGILGRVASQQKTDWLLECKSKLEGMLR
ncbi:AAA family ATPase [bacterium]|nr:AAA family ATPase [bacterium]